jgi:haloacetate dehalogenase
MALDWPDRLWSVAMLDIVPTYTMFMETNRHLAMAYWHWYFLAHPEPFPERIIGADPDYFFETALAGFGAARIEDFDPHLMAEYRRCWHDPGMIHGSCSDYRAAATVDIEHDGSDLHKKIACPTLIFWGANGLMAKNFDMERVWRDRCTDVSLASLPSGHFFIDQFPEETAEILQTFIGSHP